MAADKSTWHRCKRLLRFLWPPGECILQVRVFACLVLLVLTRLLTLLVPVVYKRLINALTTTEQTKGSTAPRWDIIIFYIVMKSMVGNGGYLNVVRHLLWIPVSQGTHKRLRVDLFGHILGMSLRWHLQRKTGEVLRVIDRGVTSVEVILSEVVFSMLPAIADVSIAVLYFISAFDFFTGLIVGLTMIGYVGCTMLLSRWMVHYRREKNAADNARQAAIVDAILNFETVKYYSAEEWEVRKYDEALQRQSNAEWLVSASADMRQAGRRTMMSLGLAIGSLLCAWYVQQGEHTVGDYVLFVSYLEQVYVPLNSFGDYYKRVQQASVDMENMFDMLEDVPDVLDAADADDLEIEKGKIEFQNVSFHYNPERPIIQNMSWTVAPGQTIALVGHSGSGKSTIVRLLLRFYDVTSGRILIDGRDIRDVRQKSLRQQMAVVPQDAILFNKDIEYNIRYGRPTASDKEVLEAAVSADIHRRIVTFTGGYSTKVGERGLKLSGGEKQRIVIARTILKGAKVMLLDEATSSLDTKTERAIQAALSRVCKDKTTIIVAHRLSTIVHANHILVLDEGRIVESGTHDDLFALCGRYWEMWEAQLRQEQRTDLAESENEVPERSEDELASDVDLNGYDALIGDDDDGGGAEQGIEKSTLLRKRQTSVLDGIRKIPRF